MTSHKQALIDLRDKVKAGEFERPDSEGGSPKFNAFMNCAEAAFGAYGPFAKARIAWEAYRGSLDAAKALHEAVLPGWGWHIRQDEKDGSCHAHTLYPNYRVSPGGVCLEGDPARAWLLAILEALIDQEGDT